MRFCGWLVFLHMVAGLRLPEYRDVECVKQHIKLCVAGGVTYIVTVLIWSLLDDDASTASPMDRSMSRVPQRQAVHESAGRGHEYITGSFLP